MKKIFKRYFIDALSAMAMGLFSSLIIGLILSQMAKLPYLTFLSSISEILSPNSPVVGAIIGISIAFGLKSSSLTMFSCGAVSALAYIAGGPLAAFISTIIANEIGNFIDGKIPINIILVPLATIISGIIISNIVSPYINHFMNFFGEIINKSTELSPIFMGMSIAVLVGMALTLPISSAAICIVLGLSGLAGGAALAGCSAQMVGFAVTSFYDNGISGILSQGLGTSMLQISNIMKKPIIWLAPTIASAVCGGLSTTIFKMQTSPLGAGMGTSGLVGQIDTFSTMSSFESNESILLKIVLLHFIIPIIISLSIDFALKKAGRIKKGDMKINI